MTLALQPDAGKPSISAMRETLEATWLRIGRCKQSHLLVTFSMSDITRIFFVPDNPPGPRMAKDPQLEAVLT